MREKQRAAASHRADVRRWMADKRVGQHAYLEERRVVRADAMASRANARANQSELVHSRQQVAQTMRATAQRGKAIVRSRVGGDRANNRATRDAAYSHRYVDDKVAELVAASEYDSVAFPTSALHRSTVDWAPTPSKQRQIESR